jgi:hypothetical protein
VSSSLLIARVERRLSGGIFGRKEGAAVSDVPPAIRVNLTNAEPWVPSTVVRALYHF